MIKNIVLGALAGAAIAYLYVDAKNGKNIENAYHHIGDYLMKMKHKMKHDLKKGKHETCGRIDHARKAMH